MSPTQHPFSSKLPPNPTVQAMIDAVSVDRLAADMERLVAFHTRHTNSSTTSPTRGIGAARRWIHDQFAAQGSAPGARLEASFFTFRTTVCGKAGEHKNVVATLPGDVTPDRHFVIAAHMDTRSEERCDATSHAPGADDDGSGTVVLIEMARALAGHALESTVILTAVTGEEQGLLGSKAYAAAAFESGMRIDGMVTNDMVGCTSGCADPRCPPGEERLTNRASVRHFSEAPSTSNHRQLTRAMKLNAERYLPDFTVDLIPARDRPSRGGDHLPFTDLGYAAGRFTEPHEDYGRQHNETDTVENLDMEYIARMAQVNLAGIATFALAPESPAQPSVEPLPNGDLRITWPSVTSVPDLAGYRVALRRAEPDELFYFDIFDAGSGPGDVQTFIVEDLTPDVPVHVSVSAYDTDGNESIFSLETRAVPAVRLTASPTATETATPTTETAPPSSTPHRAAIWLPRLQRESPAPYGP